MCNVSDFYMDYFENYLNVDDIAQLADSAGMVNLKLVNLREW